MSSSMSSHPRPPTYANRLSRSIPALILLSVVTSLAFNRAILARQRKEAEKLHTAQLSLLQQIAQDRSSFTSSLKRTTGFTTSSVLEEDRKLARRCKILQLDPLGLGFSKKALPSEEEEIALRRARESTTSWSTALFGSGSLGRAREALGTTAGRVREGLAGKAQPPVTDDDDGMSQAERDWVRAIEEAAETSSTEAQREKESKSPWPTGLREEEAPRIEPRDEKKRKKRSWSFGWNFLGSRGETEVAKEPHPILPSKPSLAQDSKDTRGRRVFL